VRVKRIDHIVLTVKDLEATCLFYERVLGMEARVMPNGRTSLHFGTQKINLHPVESEVEPRARMPTVGSIDLCFVINRPISDAVDELEKLEVPLIEGPVERTGALGPMASVYINDPDGNLVEVSSYERGDP
jgi:catechol 2,3-dioxygenase-like lactoylglutathione lyase family enzyme